jgi:hypothetical protein
MTPATAEMQGTTVTQATAVRPLTSNGKDDDSNSMTEDRMLCNSTDVPLENCFKFAAIWMASLNQKIKF